MSTESFWPVRAHEWVALVGGVVGGITGISALILSIKNYRRDRPDLDLKLELDRVIIGHRDYDPKKSYVSLQAINKGRRELQINRADVHLYRGGGYLIVGSIGSRLLSEKNPECTFLLEKGLVQLRDVWFFSVTSGSGQEFRHYVHPWNVRLWRLLMNRKARRELKRKVEAEHKKARAEFE